MRGHDVPTSIGLNDPVLFSPRAMPQVPRASLKNMRDRQTNIFTMQVNDHCVSIVIVMLYSIPSWPRQRKRFALQTCCDVIVSTLEASCWFKIR